MGDPTQTHRGLPQTIWVPKINKYVAHHKLFGPQNKHDWVPQQGAPQKYVGPAKQIVCNLGPWICSCWGPTTSTPPYYTQSQLACTTWFARPLAHSHPLTTPLWPTPLPVWLHASLTHCLLHVHRVV